MVEKAKVEDLSSLLDNIAWGYRVIEVDVEGQRHSLAFRPLSLAERNASQFMYDQTFRNAIADGTPTQDELMVKANSRGLWHPARDEQVDGLREELLTKASELEDARAAREGKVGQKRIQLKATKRHSKEKLLQRRIDNLQKQLFDLLELRSQVIEFPSAEHQASHARAIHAICCATMMFPDLEQKWPTMKDIQATSETALVFQLISMYGRTDIIPEENIRELARSGVWRLRWNTAKNIGGFDQLFDVSLSDLTPDQLLLLHWSQVYDSAFDAYERPPDRVIDDDKEFDKWMDKVIKEQEQERNKRFYSNKRNSGLGKASSINANEVFVPTDGFYSDVCTCGAIDKFGIMHDKRNCTYGVFFYYNGQRQYDEVDRVQDINPSTVRIVLASEAKALKGKGQMREESLRKYKGLARQVMGFNTNVGGQSPTDKKRGR